MDVLGRPSQQFNYYRPRRSALGDFSEKHSNSSSRPQWTNQEHVDTIITALVMYVAQEEMEKVIVEANDTAVYVLLL